jgi:hypothetical protein
VDALEVVYMKVYAHELLLEAPDDVEVALEGRSDLRVLRVVENYHHLVEVVQVLNGEGLQGHPFSPVDVELQEQSLPLESLLLDFILDGSEGVLPIDLTHLADADRFEDSSLFILAANGLLLAVAAIEVVGDKIIGSDPAAELIPCSDAKIEQDLRMFKEVFAENKTRAYPFTVSLVLAIRFLQVRGEVLCRA